MTYRILKRSLDLAIAIPALILLAPLLVVIGFLVLGNLGSPILFRQERAGLGGRPFHLFKFRSMTDARDHMGKLLPDADRLPAFGRWLRSTSLDELPQLLNVLRGEMSLVGPRPLYLSYIPRYSPSQARRLEAKPGITGLAQVRGRNALTWEEKFRLDVEYVERRSLWLDLHILWQTLAAVLLRRGVSQEGHATMAEFMGTGPGDGAA